MTPSVSALDPFAPSAVEDPYPVLDRLRADAPVWRVPGTTVHLVSSWDLVTEASDRPGDFSSHLTSVLLVDDDGGCRELPMDGDGAVEQVLATADEPAHRLHRTLVLRGLGRLIRALDADVTTCAEDLWTAGREDWVAMADRLPMRVLLRLIGLPAADEDLLLRLAYASTELLGGVVASVRVAELTSSTIELYGYLDDQLGRSGADTVGVLGALAGAVRDGELEHGTAVLVLLQLVGAGAESTSGLIATAGRELATDADLQRRLRAEPGLVEPFLEECLRLESPFRGHYRTVVRDTVLGGVPLAAGDHLVLMWGAANRDPAAFPDPDHRDLTRPGIRRHVGFGHGLHLCLGSALARREAAVAIRLLLARTRSVRLDDAAPPVRVPSLMVRRHARLPLVVEEVR